MHSWDYSGPYHGYDGFAIFAKDMDLTLNNPCWKMLTPPWQKKPEAEALKQAA
jgi:nitrogenase molybdenum-iron protein alpha chain